VKLGLLPERFEVLRQSPRPRSTRQVGEHDAGSWLPRDGTVGHRLRHRLCQPAAIGQFRQQAVRRENEFLPSRHYRAVDRAATMHLQGGLLLCD